MEEGIRRRRSILVAMVGNALETYDVVLYGYFAALIAPLFFPADNIVTSAIAAMGVFALSFVMRPLGGLIFGHFGDRLGRKKTLLLSIMLMSLPTLVIGLLPTYHEIGVLAPLILMMSLLLQGMCAGGAYSGAAIFINEHAKRGREGFASSLLSTSGFFGAVLVTGIGSFFTMMFMPAWAWRIPFVIGGLLGLVIFTLRHIVDESPTFVLAEKQEPIAKLPFFDVLKHRKMNMLCAMGIGGAAFIPFYTVSIFMNMFLTTKLGMPSSQVFLVNLSTMVLWMILLPGMGHLSDRVGKKRLMTWSSLGILIFAFPCFIPLEYNLTIENVLIMQAVLSFISAAFVAPSSAFLPKLFKVQERYSGVSVSYFLGVALFGGTTPLIAASLLEWTGHVSSPALYLLFGGLLGLVSVNFSKKIS